MSARHGALESMVVLLDSGADIKVKIEDGYTPFEVAEFNIKKI